MTTQLQRQLSIYQLINPVPILTEHKRCADRREHDFMYVQPTESENLLRIAILDPRQKHQHVVFCTGPLQEIYNEFFLAFHRRSSGSVIVGTRLPRFSVFALSCPVWLNTLWECIVPMLK